MLRSAKPGKAKAQQGKTKPGACYGLQNRTNETLKSKAKAKLEAASQTDGKRSNTEQTWHILRSVTPGKATHDKAKRNLAHDTLSAKLETQLKTKLKTTLKTKLKAKLKTKPRARLKTKLIATRQTQLTTKLKTKLKTKLQTKLQTKLKTKLKA